MYILYNIYYTFYQDSDTCTTVREMNILNNSIQYIEVCLGQKILFDGKNNNTRFYFIYTTGIKFFNRMVFRRL